MTKSIGFALDPSNVPTFLLDWELTRLCNLDCSYCGTDGIFGGHDNTTKHPPLDECLNTIDFMYNYVDMYMQHKKISQRKVVLNVYGGESIFHPNIVEILKTARERYSSYKDKWHLTITCTTNGIIGSNQWSKIVDLIDEFSVSYHAETLPKQKEQYLKNVLFLKEKNKRFKCVIMMHNDPVLFEEAEKIEEFCQQHKIRYVKKPLDNIEEKWSYSPDQFNKLKTFWIKSVPVRKQEDYKQYLDNTEEADKIHSLSQGRPCCGGRKLSLDNDLKSSVTFVNQQGFKDWYCSVNWFFLFVRQSTGDIYTNKDCRTSTTGRVEPLGNLKNYQQVLNTVQAQFDNKAVPIIKCVKEVCICGFCAPKAEKLDDFKLLLDRHIDKEKYYGNQTV